SQRSQSLGPRERFEARGLGLSRNRAGFGCRHQPVGILLELFHAYSCVDVDETLGAGAVLLELRDRLGMAPSFLGTLHVRRQMLEALGYAACPLSRRVLRGLL